MLAARLQFLAPRWRWCLAEHAPRAVGRVDKLEAVEAWIGTDVGQGRVGGAEDRKRRVAIANNLITNHPGRVYMLDCLVWFAPACPLFRTGANCLNPVKGVSLGYVGRIET